MQLASTLPRFAMSTPVPPSPISFTSDYGEPELDAATVVGDKFVAQAKQPKWVEFLAKLPNVRVEVHTSEQKIDVGLYEPYKTTVSIFIKGQEKPFAVLTPYQRKQGLTAEDAKTWLSKLGRVQIVPEGKSLWEKAFGDGFRAFMNNVCNIAWLGELQVQDRLEKDDPIHYSPALDGAPNATEIKSTINQLVPTDIRKLLNTYKDQLKMTVLYYPETPHSFVIKVECTDEVGQHPEVAIQSASMPFHVDDMSFVRSEDTRRAFKDGIENPLNRMAFFGIKKLAPIPQSMIYHSLKG